MFTLIKLPRDPNPLPQDNDNVWVAQQDPDDASRFMLAHCNHNRDLWRETVSSFEPGSKIARRLCLIVGHTHNANEQVKIERANHQRYQDKRAANKIGNSILPANFRL